MTLARSPIDVILAALPGARRMGTGWIARCPCHDDRRASLSVGENPQGDVLLHCHAGCPAVAVVQALGLEPRDLFAEGSRRPAHSPPGRRIVTTYDYHAADGTLLYQTVRYEPKGFAQRRPNGCGGWAWDLHGVERVLYRLPQLLAAPPATPVYVVEGEQDADRLGTLGLVATTNVGGAKKWRPEYGAVLGARHVVILPDHDAPGEEHAAIVAAALQGVAASVRVLRLPNLPPKGDVSDWLDSGGTAAALEALVAAGAVESAGAADAPGPVASPNGQEEAAGALDDLPRLPFRTGRELAAETPDTVEWIAAPWAARGAITEFDGKLKASGKTTLLTHLAHAVIHGTPFLGQPTTPSAVIYLTEQNKTTFREAQRRAGLLDADDLHVLCYPEVAGTEWPVVVAATVAQARRVGAGVLIVDTLSQWAGITGDAENNAGDAHRAMAPLQAAAETGLAILVARHERKGGGDVGESARGSSAFSGVVDTVVSVRRPPGDAEAASNVRVLQSLSRFDEVPETLVVELTDAGYEPLGNVLAYASEQAEQRLLRVMPPWQDKAQTADQLAEAAKTTRSLTGKLLAEMAAAGKVCRRGEGKKGDPFRYWRESVDEVEMLSSTYRGGVVEESIWGDAAPMRAPGGAIHSSTTPIVVDESAEAVATASDSGEEMLSSTTHTLYVDECISSSPARHVVAWEAGDH